MANGNGSESREALYSARPILRVSSRRNESLEGGLLSLLVEESTAGLYRCEAVFGNLGSPRGDMDFLYFDRQVLDFGKPFEVEIGAGDTQATVFRGKITALEAHFGHVNPPEMVVLAEDRLQDLRMVRRTRTFEDVSDQDIFQKIASEHGLQADLDVNGPTYRALTQVNQSDLAFLRDRARSIDAELWVEGDKLLVKSRSRRQSGQVSLVYGRRLIEFSVLADLAIQRTSLTVSGWDVSAKQVIEHQASASVLGSEVQGLTGGASLLQSSFGERAERVVHQAPFTSQEARSLAEAHFKAMARRFVTGRGVAEGHGKIRVGAQVDLKGLGEMFSGKYYVTAVRHMFNLRDGLRTHFSVERPGIGA